MHTRQVEEHGDASVLAPGHWSPATTDTSRPASLVLALQRSAGNGAVVRELARRGSRGVFGAQPARTVQRCGPVPCDCPAEERAEHAAKNGALVGEGTATEDLTDRTGDTTRPVPVQRDCACEGQDDLDVQRMLAPGPVLQRVPGDGMEPPGDCSYGTYIPLRLSVESAKAIVSMLGACAPGDSCTLLAMKIAAITAEIAARVALDATCFKGGNTGHRQQVQDKISMVNRCHRFFQDSNCPQSLVAAMEVVVASARAVVEAAAVGAAAALVIAAVAALVAAIIALAEVIAAAAVAAAEAVLIASAAAALAALLIMLRENLSPGSPSSA